MCGIVGIVGEENRELVRKMCDIIEHRGPDDSGYFIDKDISLGVRRLSIIDIAGGKQPIHNEDETVWVVYNGEIYNYLELKRELEDQGHKFHTKCDTETFVHAYEQYGEKFVEKLRGMFAFAIWDVKNKKIILGRDRLGKKPLYYTVVDGNLVFGSEIKAILQYGGIERKVNWRALHNFLTLGYVPGPDTMFDEIYKLQPGHILVYQNKEIKISKYWELEINNVEISEESAVKKTLELLKESVKIRLMSEVPLGVHLSGGLDSSSVVALMSQVIQEPIKTFTVGFGQSDDEFEYARIVAEKFKTDHKELIVKSDVIKILPNVIWHFDEPLADAAALPVYQMSEVTKKYATVVLLGEGGDESFAGYPKYRQMLNVMKYSKPIPYSFRKYFIPLVTRSLSKLIPDGRNKKYLEFITETFPLTNEEKKTYLNFITAGFNETNKTKLYSGNLVSIVNNYSTLNQVEQVFTNNTLLNNMLKFDFKVWLCDRLLMKVDKMTMANSVEARVPFLDHKLVEFVNTLPENLRLDKYTLKKAMSGILPDEIVKRKKRGFFVPITPWLNSELKEVAVQILAQYVNFDNFNFNYIQNHVLNNPKRFMHNYQIWNLMIFKLWHKMFIENDSVTKPQSLDKLIG